MTPVELSRTVLHAVRRAVEQGELSVAVPERVVVTEPGAGGCGDYATNVALQLARSAGLPPLRVAEILLPYLVGAEGIRDVVVTGPGFLNISLEEQADVAEGVVRDILECGGRYGYGSGLAGEVVVLRVPYEARAEVVADAVVRIVGTQGGRCEVEHGEPVNLRPVPAPEDPAPLGADAAQWALLHPAPHDRPRITADHLVQRESNPLFRVRYAHARVRAVSRNAGRLGFSAEPGPVPAREILTALSDYPRILTAAATHRGPDRLARHLVTVADAVLPFLPTVLPRGEEKPSAAHRARLALAEAAGTVLAGGLSLLGIDAPEHL
ncbi:ArgS-related anticodon-binding protein NrtL [Streptomyces sp. Ag109_G2-15]|uniref:ArgS-related anticodon-binding protein NrtL n=1 Tax=Streptomyces sp. Ag109_G2-15 TaxID=1938850 RepID=UPI000BD86CF6|nr:DALR anticodon-binding domain-containing protein [Streptomyces sp. Ag109_G2-15]SOD83762.1 arginyl-tRNA synthetase [Streptomyces sp. Ag109_G2-15]